MAKSKKTKAKKTTKVSKTKTAKATKVAKKKNLTTVTKTNTRIKSKANAASEKTAYTKEELEYFKNIILEKRKEVIEDLETLRDSIMDPTTGEYSTENPSYSLHMEQGTDTMEREKTFLFASREGKFLNYLDDALRRIESGNYGKCIVCGKLIDKGRLEAVPHAQMCVACKDKQKQMKFKPSSTE